MPVFLLLAAFKVSNYHQRTWHVSAHSLSRPFQSTDLSSRKGVIMVGQTPSGTAILRLAAVELILRAFLPQAKIASKILSQPRPLSIVVNG